MPWRREPRQGFRLARLDVRAFWGYCHGPLLRGGSRLLGAEAASVQSVARSNVAVASQVARDVDRQNGIDTEGVGALVREARRVIVAARGALN